MTKPIFEPTPQRQVSALRYDKNQLQRRPAPSGMPLEWARCEFTADQTFVPNGDQILSWDNVYIPAGQTAITAGVSATNPFTVEVGGLYAVSFWHQWTTAFTQQHFGHIDSQGNAYPANPMYGISMGPLDQGQVVTASPWLIDAATVPDPITFFIYKEAGSGSRTLTFGSAVIMYFGPVADPSP